MAESLNTDQATAVVDQAIAYIDELRDALRSARQEVRDLREALAEEQDKSWEFQYLLKDVLDIEAEMECIGGGPGWKERRAKAYAAAWEKFEGGD